MVVIRGEGQWGRMKWVEGLKYMIMKGGQTAGIGHTREYTDVIL